MTYRAPVRDIRFSIEEIAAVEGLKATGAFPDFSDDVAVAILEEAGKLTTDVLGPLNWTGDQQGCTLENGVVRTPDGFKEAYDKFVEGGWQGLQFPAEHGGMGLPRALGCALMEMLQSANMAFGLGPMLSFGAIEALIAHGSDELRALYLPRIINAFQAGGADNYIGEALALAGGSNAAGHLPGDPILGPEQILELDPDVILIGSFDSGATVHRLLEDSRLAPARAVAGQRVFKVPVGGYRWDPPSQESPLFWLWLGHRLHPDAGWPDLAATVQEGLRLLYDLRVDRQTAATIAAGQWR